jgi:hypothetical protein
MCHTMAQLHERFTNDLFEARWRSGEHVQFHRGENKQSHHADEQKSETDKMKQIVIELTNMPVLALVMPVSKPAEKPDPTHSDTTISFLDIIEIILKVIVDGAKAIFPKRKEKN